MDNLKLVIVGHVDHGKSTLIGRLFYDTGSLPEGKIEEIQEICDSLGRELEFGFVMDHLKEERKQGITIDTAQTFFKTDKRKYTIIDAPGHVEFLKNMITGATQAEAAVLIVDAKEGVKEQTTRHAYILSMLGLDQVLVAINKMDLVGYNKERYEEVKTSLLGFLDKINIQPSYVIPICAKEGDFVANKTDNLSWFEGPTVLDALDKFKTKKSPINKPLRFSVQDVYKLDKRITVGRVESGRINEEDKIVVLPYGKETTISSVLEFGKNPDRAEAGKNIGIETDDKIFMERGNIIAEKGKNMPVITDTVKAHIFWLDKKGLQKKERLRFKCATQEIMCDIEKINKVIDSSTLETVREDTDTIENREVADIVIKTEKPVVVENFNEVPELGRFVLERMDTCAGGVITDIE